MNAELAGVLTGVNLWVVSIGIAVLVARRAVMMGYQPRAKLPKVTVTEVDAVTFTVDVPRGFIGKECRECGEIYLLRLPPSLRAEKTTDPWRCKICERKHIGVYR